jgi:hypothetical protein
MDERQTDTERAGVGAPTGTLGIPKAWEDTAPPKDPPHAGQTHGCEGCARFGGVRWLGDAQRVVCGDGLADRRIKIYTGCGLRRAADERQRELF